MTTDELEQLPAGTIIYVPQSVDVMPLILDQRVHDTDYFTLRTVDADGTITTKRPIYLYALDLLNATTSETEAWECVLTGLNERREWIKTYKLK